MSDNQLTIKTNVGMVTGDVRIWLAVLLDSLPETTKSRILERVKQMESGKLTIINPDGSTTTVLRAERGVLNSSGSNLGG